MKNQTLEDAILKVVMFWSNKSFRTPMNQNNGDDSPNGGMSFMLLNMVAKGAQDEVTPEQITRFEMELSKLLTNANDFQKTLSVDYGPCELLANAADYAKIGYGCFPCKTVTWISDNNIATARYQYGGKKETL